MSNIELTKIRMINWHACADSGVVPLRGDTMIAGPTGAGKSTLLDAVYSTLFINANNFNKAANAKSKRDLKSYIRWKSDERDKNGNNQRYKRNGKVVSYIAIELINHGETNVLGVCYISPNENAQVEKIYFIAKSDLESISFLNDHKCPLDFKAFQDQFDNKSLQVAKVQRDAKRMFAIAMGFKKDQVDLYEKVGEQITKTMAFDPSELQNIDKFIKTNILQESTLDITEIESFFNTLSDLYKRLEENEARAEALSEIIENIEILEKNEAEQRRRRVLYTVAAYTSKKETAEHLSNELDDCKNSEKNCAEDIEDAEKRKESYVRQEYELRNSDANRQLIQLKEQKTKIETRLQYCEKIKSDIQERLRALYSAIEYGQIELECDSYDFDDFEDDYDLVSDCMKSMEDLKDAITSKIANNNTDEVALKAKRQSIVAENAATKTGMLVSGNCTVAARLINEHFAANGINDKAVMVYQCVDFKSGEEDWQQAIETMLGNARFNIAVEPENYHNAVDIVAKNRLYGVSVIDAAALNDDCCREDSVCNLMTYSNKHVENYLKYRFGKIIAIDTCKNGVPNSNHNYLGKDSTVYRSKAFSLTDTKKIQCCIGEDAKRQMVLANEKQIAEIDQQVNQLTQQNATLVHIRNCARCVTDCLPKITEDMLHDLRQLSEELRDINCNINTLVSENNMYAVEERLSALQRQIAECNEQKKEADAERVELLQRIGRLQHENEKIRFELAELEPQYMAFKNECADEFERACEEYDDLLNDKRKSIKSIFDILRSEIRKLENEHAKVNGNLENQQRDYCDNFNNMITFGGIDSAEEYKAEYQGIVVVGLPDLREQVKSAQENEVAAIKQTLIEHYKHCFIEAERKNRELNATLRKASYGNRTYSLTAIKPAEGYERFYNMIKGAEDGQNAEFTDKDYEEFYEFIRSDENNLDYRNFLATDVAVKIKDANSDKIIEKRLSDTILYSSGGETQIPFYILSAMSLVSAYSEDRSDEALKIMMIDEAFDKMDSQTIGTMMEYLRELGFQTILSAPDSKNEIIRKYMTTRIFVVNRVQGRAFVGVADSNRKFLSFTDKSA